MLLGKADIEVFHFILLMYASLKSLQYDLSSFEILSKFCVVFPPLHNLASLIFTLQRSITLVWRRLLCCLILWEIHLSTLLPRRMLGLLLLGKVGFFVAAIDELDAVVVAIDQSVVVSDDDLVAVVTPQNFQLMEHRAV